MDVRRIAFIEPHLKRYGGIRRVVELSNAMIARGHEVTLFVPPWERVGCDWMRCDAEVRPLDRRHPEPYDLVVFNHEPQWYLLERFTGARAHAAYFLHFSELYGKEGSWESLRAPVDLRLANSTWTASQVQQAIGQPVHRLSGGINPAHFRPVDVPKRYPLLCVGDDREWKGTADIEDAARRLGLPLERYAGKDLPQSEMAAEYSAAEVFVVGSHVEGFGQPGLEALACGTPLVTTDNGGCLDYAVHEETALVVPPRDPAAMTAAIRRLREEPALAARLREGGLRMVAEHFSWAAAAEQFEREIGDLLAGLDDATAVDRHRAADGSPARLREPDAEPEISVVVLQWNQLTLTQRCVETVRQHTSIPYELILVDNGSQPDAADYLRQAGDVVVLNDDNRGFAAGMNDGLAVARSPHVAFLNNDTELPAGWAEHLVETARSSERIGMVVPSLTEAGNDRTVATEPGAGTELLGAFEAPPSAVLVVMPTETVRALGGWDESYAVASGEDLDLTFSVWVNDLDVVWDRRVLVEHVGHASSDNLEDRPALWARNRQQFLDRWTDVSQPVPRLEGVPDDRFDRNRRSAAGVATWMDRYFRARDREAAAQARASLFNGAGLSDLARVPVVRKVVRGVWSTMRALVPASLRETVWPYVRRPYYRFFPDRHPSVLRGERSPGSLNR